MVILKEIKLVNAQEQAINMNITSSGLPGQSTQSER